MAHFRLTTLILVLSFLAVSELPRPAFASGRGRELTLGPQLTRELNLVLKASVNLSESLAVRNEEQIEFSLRDLIWQIDRARSSSVLIKAHERGHLLRILDSARQNFLLTQTSFGEERRARLEDAYNQLANLVRIYKLDRSYGIFFCPRDRTTWIQKGAQPLNPFHSKSQREPCGIRVPN